MSGMKFTHTFSLLPHIPLLKLFIVCSILTLQDLHHVTGENYEELSFHDLPPGQL